MRDAQVFMAVVSDNYATDPYCYQVFQYARLTLHKPLLMVVVGEGENWKKSKLGILVSDEVCMS